MTLLELLAVLAVVCIISAMAGLILVPRPDALLETAARVEDLMIRARWRAVEDQVTWRIIFSPGTGRITVFGDHDGDGLHDAAEPSLSFSDLGPSICFGCGEPRGPRGTTVPADAVSFSGNRVSFSPLGTCNAGTIYLQDEARSLALRLLPASGMVESWLHEGSWRRR